MLDSYNTSDLRPVQKATAEYQWTHQQRKELLVVGAIYLDPKDGVKKTVLGYSADNTATIIWYDRGDKNCEPTWITSYYQLTGIDPKNIQPSTPTSVKRVGKATGVKITGMHTEVVTLTGDTFVVTFSGPDRVSRATNYLRFLYDGHQG